MTPPEALLRAAALLEQAKLSRDQRQVTAMLVEARDISQMVADAINKQLCPDMEDMGARIRAGAIRL